MSGLTTTREVRALLERRQKLEHRLNELDHRLQERLRALPRHQRSAAIGACIDAGMTQGQVARMLGVSRQRVSFVRGQERKA